MHIFQGISEARELLTATNIGGHVRWNLEIGSPWIGRGIWIPPTTFSVPFFFIILMMQLLLKIKSML